MFLGNPDPAYDSDKYASWLAIELFKSGINLTYTSDLDDLNTANLNRYDGLIIYPGQDTISPSQESALRDFVEGGRGLIPIHAASGGFRNSGWYQQAVGDRLSARGKDTLKHRQGKGRVFGTARAPDEADWKSPRFLKSLRNGVLWAIGDGVRELVEQLNIPDVSIYPDSIADFTARHNVPGVQEALPPEEAMKLIQVPVDFEIKLFAVEPDIVNPIAMSWDEKGRLWVIETVDYPNDFAETEGAANDRIKICEDTDGDHVADKFTVFAEGLNIATSLTFANDGVLVAMAPYFIFLKDTDGDDVADTRDTLMTGWGKEDTHAGPSNLQYGFDNKIWGVTGYSGFKGSIGGKQYKFRQGLYRFRPDGTGFEFLASTTNNTWGLGMTEDNNVFISTANNTHSAFYSMPEKLMQREGKEEDRRGRPVDAIQKIDGHYEAHALTPNLRQVDVVGGFTSAAGHQIYTARDYPESYWNKVAFVTEPTVRLVHRAVLEPDGAGFREKDGWNLAASSDEWFGPVHAEVGPDGAVWVLDWYNFIIQHNVFVPEQAPSEKVLPFTEQPHGPGNAFESELRDKQHGRVYRIVYKKARHKQPYKLSKDDPSGLLKALKSDNKFWRMHAQRLLVERNKEDVVGDLIGIALDQQVDQAGLNGPAIHALWTLQGLNAIDTRQDVFDAVVKSLKHPSAGVRKAALQVLPLNDRSLEAMLANGVLKDAHLNTRLAAFVQLAAFPSSRTVAEALLEATDDPVNSTGKWLSQALSGAIVQHGDEFYKAASNRPLSAFASRVLESLGDKPLAVVSKEEADGPVAAQKIVIKAVKDLMQYDKKQITVKAGRPVSLVFENPDVMPHNLLVIKPGTLETVGKAADEMLRSPDAVERDYIPEMPEVLYHTPLLNPGERFILTFTAPAEKGDYPYVCTFPGHWRGMNGVMRVVD